MSKDRLVFIRDAEPTEFAAIGKLMIEVYSNLPGFPSISDQPKYYQMLATIGNLTNTEGTQLIVAVNDEGQIAGGVVYFREMSHYGSGGTATAEKNAAGFRLLAVGSSFRGLGIGKKLTNACIALAIKQKKNHVVIHSTKAMKRAWLMYEKMGFQRAIDLDFMQENLPVCGFRLFLNKRIL